MVNVGGVEDGDGVGQWDMDQADLVGAIIQVAESSGVNRGSFRRNRALNKTTHGKGSDLGGFVPILHADAYLRAGRLATSAIDEFRMRCSGVRDVAMLVKRAVPLLSMAGSIRLRGLW